MSLLLDALKKAALEKQRREHNEATNPTQAPKKIEQAQEITPAQERVVDLEIEDTPHQKVDIGEVNTQLLDEVEPELTLTIISEAVGASDAAEYNDEQNIHDEFKGPELVFDIDDTDSEYLEQDHTAPIQQDFSENPDQEPIIALREIDEQPQSIAENSKHVSDGAVQSVESIKSSQPIAQQTTPESKAEAAKPVEQFNPAAGKAALATLLSRSSKVAENARKRMIIMYLLLAITAGTVLVLYYYFLFSDNSSIAPSVSNKTSVNVGSVNPMENPPETDNTADTNATHAISGTTTKDTLVETNNSITENTADKTNKNSTIEKIERNSAKEKNSTADARLKTPTNVASDVADKNTNTPHAQISNAPKQNFTGKTGTVTYPINSLIERGYRAYQEGDLNRAESAYREALAQDKYDRDALLGAAAVAVGQGRQQDALSLYQKRLTREPRDEYAQAGIVALSAGNEPSPQLESELNRLLLEYPNASYLHFLKGSLYAKQKQWNAAQASFFEAWQRDNKNADLACNLAIALDHLNQPKEAARFYRQALELKTNHPGFSVEAIQRRIQELEVITK